jgi:IS5 family transposase
MLCAVGTMSKQMSLVEALVDQRLGSNEKLEAIDRAIDWSRLEPIVREVRTGETGRPPYAPLTMIKALYLQRLYDLSDPGLEEALLDRLSFRAFCGLAMDARTPDETTFCRFRAAVAEAGVMEKAFAEIVRQLEAQGLVLKKGSLLDASVIKAKHNPPPRSAGLGAKHPEEPEADWTYRRGVSLFGYKAHIGIDQGSGLVRRVVVTPAKVYESEVADALIVGDEGAVYADKAYPQKARHARLAELGIKDRIMRRANKHHPVLPRWRRRWNDLVARRRAPVEAVFSAMKRLYGLARARCSTLARNTADVFAFAAIYNLRRATILRPT